MEEAIKKVTGEMESLLTVDELAAKVKIPKSFFYAPCRRKGPDAIPAYRIGKYIRYSFPEVMKWIESRRERF